MKTTSYRARALGRALQSGTLKGPLCALLATTATCGLTAAPAHAQSEIAPPPAYTMTPTGVNLQDGRFVHSNQDLSIGPPDLGMSVTRFYSSLEPPRHGSWGFSFNMYIATTGVEETGPHPDTWTYSISVVLGSNSLSFQRVGASKAGDYYDAGDGSTTGWSLSYSTATTKYTLIDRQGQVYTFETNGKVETIVAPNGLRHDFTYHPDSSVRTVFNNAGYGIIRESASKICAVNLAQDHVTSSSNCPASAPAATYAYNSVGLTGFTDASGKSTAYEYDGGAHRLSCVRRPSTGPCEIGNVYEGSGTVERHDDRVTSQSTATGESYSYSYNGLNPTPVFPGVVNDKTIVTGPSGSTVTTFMGVMPNSHSDELGRKTDYLFVGTDLASVTMPEGNKGEYPLDDRGNRLEYRQKAKPNTGLADLVATASYPASCPDPKTCNKPEFVADANANASGNGNRTDFTYDPNHGGVLTETGPAVNGVRPQKRYSYQQRHAYVKDGSGALVQAAAPVWVLTQVAQCQTQASCAGGADEVRTIYEYASGAVMNALSPRGVLTTGNGVSSRSCQRYDRNGRAISETGGGANLSSCPAQ